MNNAHGHSPIPCEWCGAASDGRTGAGAGTFAHHCDRCKPKCLRWIAALNGQPDASWLSSTPDLVIMRAGQPTTTIKDGRGLKPKALKALLPPVKAASRRATGPVRLTPEQEVDRIAGARAKRRREEAADNAKLAAIAERRDLKVAQIAERMGVSRQAIYQLAA